MMGRLVDMQPKMAETARPKTPPGFMPGEILTEYVRQTYHLFRGETGERGLERVGRASIALWCLRRTGWLKTMQCAFFSSEGRSSALPVLEQILAYKKPDAATIRIMHRPSNDVGRSIRIKVIGRHLLFSTGTDTSFELISFSGDFETFLGALGKKTRSHIRSSLRTFARGGYRYCFDAPARLKTSAQIRDLAARNMPHAPAPERLELQTNYANEQEMPFQSALSAPDGTIISVIRGYLLDSHAVLVDQMNPETYPKIGQTGPSLLHRALLIQALIERNMQGLVVTGGCGGMLTRYCRPVTFQSYVALSLNPLSWLRCLRFFFRNPSKVLWALRRFLSGGASE